MPTKDGVAFDWGWVILVKPKHARWRLGYHVLFDSRKSAQEFLHAAEWNEQTRVVRGSLRAAIG